MNVDNFPELLSKFTRNYLRQVHTIKPAIVTKVNHSKNTLDAKILTNTKYGSGVNMPQPDVRNVPFFILSASKGNAKITMPLTPGDNVLILFSDRDYGNLLKTGGSTPVDSKDLKTHEYDPILALPCFYTTPNATEVDSSNIVISNGASSITIAPDGNIDVLTTADTTITATNLTVNASGAVNITAPTTTINGNLVVTGTVVGSSSVTAPSIVGTTSVTFGGIDASVHTHDLSGGGTTLGPTGA